MEITYSSATTHSSTGDWSYVLNPETRPSRSTNDWPLHYNYALVYLVLVYLRLAVTLLLPPAYSPTLPGVDGVSNSRQQGICDRQGVRVR